jgi:hypothetical protein
MSAVRNPQICSMLPPTVTSSWWQRNSARRPGTDLGFGPPGHAADCLLRQHRAPPSLITEALQWSTPPHRGDRWSDRRRIGVARAARGDQRRNAMKVRLFISVADIVGLPCKHDIIEIGPAVVGEFQVECTALRVRPASGRGGWGRGQRQQGSVMPSRSSRQECLGCLPSGVRSARARSGRPARCGSGRRSWRRSI